jgi:hypothetical protein
VVQIPAEASRLQAIDTIVYPFYSVKNQLYMELDCKLYVEKSVIVCVCGYLYHQLTGQATKFTQTRVVHYFVHEDHTCIPIIAALVKQMYAYSV